MKYFKVLSCDEGIESAWLEDEFKSGRLRVGWSWPGLDLRQLENKPDSDCDEDELLAWRKTQFLVKRIQAGDRIVCQFQRPLREFWVGEVTGEGYEFEPMERADFNHILGVKSLTPMAIPINAKFIPGSLRHDLSKRNNYYEIYPKRSIEVLNKIIRRSLWGTEDLQETREMTDEFAGVSNAIVKSMIGLIRNSWPSKHFEFFCAELLRHADFVEVHSEVDEHRVGAHDRVQVREEALLGRPRVHAPEHHALPVAPIRVQDRVRPGRQILGHRGRMERRSNVVGRGQVLGAQLVLGDRVEDRERRDHVAAQRRVEDSGNVGRAGGARMLILSGRPRLDPRFVPILQPAERIGDYDAVIDIDSAVALCRRLGLLPGLCRNLLGFIGLFATRAEPGGNQQNQQNSVE